MKNQTENVCCMKLDTKQLTAFEKCLRAGTVLAIAALAAGTLMYAKIEKRVYTFECESKMTDNLIEAEEFRMLLHELNNGQAKSVASFLKSKAAFDLTTADSLTAPDDAQGKEYAAQIVRYIASDKGIYSKYYLASAGLPKAPKTDAARH